MAEINLLTQTMNNKEKKIDTKHILQINRIKLIDYIQCGLIVPDKYLGGECENDLQSKNKDYLLLSDGYIKELDESQILIELILIDDERAKLHKVDELFYFDIPLPLSRIKKIYAQDKEVIKHIKVNILNSDCGFLPDELFDVYKIKAKISFKKNEYTAISRDIIASDYTDQIRKFDKRMGMFSFMKNTNLYYSNQTGTISNYSDHYFSALSLLLKEKLDEKSFELFDILRNNEEFKKLIYSDSQIDKEFLIQTVESIEDEELKEVFSQLLGAVGGRKALSILLEKGAFNLYFIGLVYYFRQKSANRKDNFKIEIKDLIPYQVAEVSLAILGIYLGYKNIRASEHIDLNDQVFKKLLGNSVAMKFTMESKLDYITIETIYNSCFNCSESTEYDYLQYPTKKPKNISKPTDTRWYEIVDNKFYFEQQYIKIQKKNFEQIINEKFEKLPDELISSKDGILLGYILQNFPTIISPVKFGEKLQISCKKTNFKEKILEEQNQRKQNRLIDLFELNGQL